MKRNVLLIGGTMIALLGAVAMANAAPGEGRPDGKKGRRIGEEKRAEMLKKFDKDGDGKLSEEERQAMREEMQKRGGERPSREEMLKKFDKDGDGELNEEERQAMREAMGGRKDAPGGKGERGAKGEGSGNRPSFEEILAKYDADGDGKLNEEERKAARADREKGKKAPAESEEE